jgi:hypothetical protein
MAAQLTFRRERGQITVVAIVVLMLVGAFGVVMTEAVTSAKREGTASEEHQQRLFMAESGLDLALQEMQAGRSGQLGSESAPISVGDGSFYTLERPRSDGTVTLFSVGKYQGHQRTIRARVRRAPHVFHHAIFAGNSSGDDDYEMAFGGRGSDGDEINGDVYSGGGVRVKHDAEIGGMVRAKEEIAGVEGNAGVAQPGFDFSEVDFEAEGIVNVAAEFASSQSKSADAGGTADQLPESNPAHIFRRNPSDRAAEWSSTPKDDYFLEDPYELVAGTDPADKGNDNYMISIDDGSGTARRTYFVDGNLWIHNNSSYSFMLETMYGGGAQVTFLVKGNITFSDSFRIQDTGKDAVGFVALVDPDVEDSGNIYMGDPAFGTLSELHAYLYAENDFLDINLDASGSKRVRLLGSMTAGDKVAIERDYRGGHSKLTVDWDKRILSGDVSLPFISTDLPSGGSGVTLEAWIESPIVPIDPGTPGAAPVAPPPVEDPPPSVLTDPEPIVEPWWTPGWDEVKKGYDKSKSHKSKSHKSKSHKSKSHKSKSHKWKSNKSDKSKSNKSHKWKSNKSDKSKSNKSHKWKSSKSDKSH